MENTQLIKKSSPASNISGDDSLEAQALESLLSGHAVASPACKGSAAPSGSEGGHISEGSSSLQRIVQQKEAPTSFKYFEQLPSLVQLLIMEQAMKNSPIDAAHFASTGFIPAAVYRIAGHPLVLNAKSLPSSPDKTGGLHANTIKIVNAPTADDLNKALKIAAEIIVARAQPLIEEGVTIDEGNFTDLDLSDLPHLPEESFFSQISGNVHRLDLSKSGLDDKTFGFIAQYLGDSIKELDCSRSTLTAAGIAQHIGKFKVLEKLDLSGIYDVFFNYNIDDAGFTALADNCIHLKELRCPSHKLSADVMKKSFPKLKELEVLHVWNRNLNGDVLSTIGMSCKKLKNLMVGNTNFAPALTAADIAAHIGKYKSLEVLKLIIADDFTDDGLGALTNNCVNLKKLTICSSLVTAAGMAHLSKLRHLERLTTGSSAVVNDDVFATICSLSQLKSLRIFAVNNLTTDGILKSLGKLTQLEEFVFPSRLLNDAVLACLAESVPRLKNIELTAEALTSQAMAQHLPKFAGLEKIVSQGVDGINDQVFEALSDHCKNLEDITIFGGTLTAAGVARNINKFRSLKRLILAGGCVTGAVLCALLEGSKDTLRYIHLHANYLTDENLSLLHQFSRLNHITITGGMRADRFNGSAHPIIQKLRDNGCCVYFH